MNLRKLMLACAPALLAAQPAAAQDYYTGQILLYAGDYCPRGTLEANGAVLNYLSYTALAGQLRDTFGGDGRTGFGLPDLRGRIAIGPGQGPGLANYGMGQRGGVETSTASQVGHSHELSLRAYAGPPNTDNPTGAAFADFPPGAFVYYNEAGPQPTGGPATTPTDGPMGANTVATDTVGGGQPVPVPGPYLALRYCIVAEGRFPSQP